MIKSDHGKIVIKHNGSVPEFVTEVTELNRAILEGLEGILVKETATELYDKAIELSKMSLEEMEKEALFWESAAAVKQNIETERTASLTVKDVAKLIEMAGDVQQKGHFVGVNFANYGNDVCVYFNRGGFDTKKNGYDRHYSFNLTDESYDLKTFKNVLNLFTEILNEPEEGEKNAGN